MAENQGPYLGAATTGYPPEAQPGGWARRLIYFASAILVIAGAFHAIMGLAAILDDSFYTVAGSYAFEIDVTTWGWLHLVGGIIFAASGFYLLEGNLLARIVAVFAAIVSGTASFWSIPYYPVWNILILTLDIAIIWAVVAHGQKFARK